MIQNKAEQIQYFYNASGLVTEVWYEGSPKVKFFYNDRNHRVKKESYHNGSLLSSTFYVRDVAGQVMAIYNSNVSSSGSQGEPYRELVKQPIYGAGRIGVQYTNGLAVYELTDHLGNVRALFTKESATDSELEGYTDYYPFGMPMPGRTMKDAEGYRYGYQGQFAEKDEETGFNAFELRLWNAKIGRWLATDPAGQYTSPYLGMGNNPVSRYDPDGGCDQPDSNCGWFKRMFYSKSQIQKWEYWNEAGISNDGLELSFNLDEVVLTKELPKLSAKITTDGYNVYGYGGGLVGGGKPGERAGGSFEWSGSRLHFFKFLMFMESQNPASKGVYDFRHRNRRDRVDIIYEKPQLYWGLVDVKTRSFDNQGSYKRRDWELIVSQSQEEFTQDSIKFINQFKNDSVHYKHWGNNSHEIFSFSTFKPKPDNLD